MPPAAQRYAAIRDNVIWLREPDPTPPEASKPLTRGQLQWLRKRERMAADPEYREKELAAARKRTREWQQRNRHNPKVVAARRAKDRAQYEANRERILQKRRQDYAGADGEKIRARNRDWSNKNREKRKAYRQAYYARNGERIRAKERARSRAEYAANPQAWLDYYKAWRAKNLERARAYVRVATLKRRAAVGSFSVDDWFDLLEAYGYKCAYCGSTEKIEADHRIPLSRGGSNFIDNIIPACKRCNRRKWKRTEQEFRALLADDARTRAAASESPSLQDEEEAAG